MCGLTHALLRLVEGTPGGDRAVGTHGGRGMQAGRGQSEGPLTKEAGPPGARGGQERPRSKPPWCEWPPEALLPALPSRARGSSPGARTGAGVGKERPAVLGTGPSALTHPLLSTGFYQARPRKIRDRRSPERRLPECTDTHHSFSTLCPGQPKPCRGRPGPGPRGRGSALWGCPSHRRGWNPAQV